MLSVIRLYLQPTCTCPRCAGIFCGYCFPLLVSDGTLCSSGGGLFRAKRENFSSARGNTFKSVTERQLFDFERVMRYVMRNVPASSFLVLFASGESAVLSFVTWLSGAEQSGLRGPSTENQEAKQAALLCIKVTCCSLKRHQIKSPLSELLIASEPGLLQWQMAEVLLKPLKRTFVLCTCHSFVNSP